MRQCQPSSTVGYAGHQVVIAYRFRFRLITYSSADARWLDESLSSDSQVWSLPYFFFFFFEGQRANRHRRKEETNFWVPNRWCRLQAFLIASRYIKRHPKRHPIVIDPQSINRTNPNLHFETLAASFLSICAKPSPDKATLAKSATSQLITLSPITSIPLQWQHKTFHRAELSSLFQEVSRPEIPNISEK